MLKEWLHTAKVKLFLLIFHLKLFKGESLKFQDTVLSNSSLDFTLCVFFYDQLFVDYLFVVQILNHI